MKTNLLQKNTAIISLICGILATVSLVLEILGPSIYVTPFVPFILSLLFYMFPLIVLLGIIFGILGLKSTKRNLAIAGIVLSLIPVVYLIGFFLCMGRFI